MPLTAQTLALSVYGALTRAPVSFTGRDLMGLSTAVGNAVSQLVTTQNAVSCSFNGTMGASGTIVPTTPIPATVSAIVMSASMYSKSLLKQYSGTKISSLFDAISNGLCQMFSTMILNGTVLGCAVGLGTGQFLAAFTDADVISLSIFKEMGNQQIKGRDAMGLSDCIAAGVSTTLKAVIFQVNCAGVISPVSPTGPVSVVQIPSATTQVS